MLKVKDLSISFQKTIFDHVTVELPCGHLIAIKGESGSGKSTFLRFIMNEVNYRSGELYYQDKLIDENSRDDFLFNHVSYIDQMGSYYPNMTIKQHFEFYAKLHGMQVNTDDILKCFEYVHLECKKLKQSPSRLSTGERKRFLIALALFLHKDIILLDEPTASLDQKSQSYLLETLKQLKNEGMTIIMTTHDEDLVEASDSVYEIEDCQINKVKENKVIPKKYDGEEKTPHRIRYGKYKNAKLRIMFILIVLIGSIAITMISQSVALTTSINTVQVEEIEKFQNSKLYFMKMSKDYMGEFYPTYNSNYNHNYNDVITEKDIQNIKSIEGVIDAKPSVRLKSRYNAPYISVYKNNNEIKKVRAQLEESHFNKLVNRDVYILGYYPEDKEAELCHNGVYINDNMNEIINIDSLENISLRIPLEYERYYYKTFDDDINKEHLVESQDIIIPIDGVMNERLYDDNHRIWDALVYMPVDKLNKLIEDNYTEITDQSTEYFVYCEDGKDTEVKLAIEEMNDLYVAENAKTSYYDIVEYIQEQNSHSRMISIIISLILLAGVFLLMFYYQSLRETEMIYMKREGLVKNIKSYYRGDMIVLLVVLMIISIIAMVVYKKIIFFIEVPLSIYMVSWVGSSLVVGFIIYYVSQYRLGKMIEKL